MDAADTRLVVIVDDDRGMRRALSRLVVAAGYHARAFECAEDADASGALARAGCLVVDVHLPGMSGTRWYASLGRVARPPAVFVTATDDGAPDAACLHKPFEGRALLRAIGEAMMRAPGPRGALN
jgi:FixJ family two-component response regulator